MLTYVAQGLVAVAGGVLMVVCLAGIAAPTVLLHGVDRAMTRRSALPAAVTVRVVLAVALLLAASASRWPVLFQVLGWLTLAAAVAIPLLGRARITSLLDWIRGVHPVIVRLWLLAGLLFGGVLLFGAVAGH